MPCSDPPARLGMYPKFVFTDARPFCSCCCARVIPRGHPNTFAVNRALFTCVALLGRKPEGALHPKIFADGRAF